uniref:MAGUK p55 subfamily member 4-like n=1 Tax=Kryptolebias marmoratus TaxID=37003 RepID=A0A3Q3AY66_KRYMA
MITIKQSMEDGISDVLSSVVEDIGDAVNRNISGAQILHELLRAPWLRALLRIYESLLQFQRAAPSPFLPYASGLSFEIMTIIHRADRPSAEARELYNLLSSPHVQALLSSHDSVAQSDYLPVLPPLPEELPEDEEAVRIVCLVKNNQPLSGEERRRSVGDDGAGVIHGRWSSLRRLTLERLIPARRAWSGEELRMTDSESRLLSRPKNQPCSFFPRYGSTGNCCLGPQNAGLWKEGLNQSTPAVFCSDSCSERPKTPREYGASCKESSDDYAYLPPPVPAYSISLPNSPLLYKKDARGGESRSIPTSGRTLVRVHTAPATPENQQSTRQQGVSTFPAPNRQHWCQDGPFKKHQEGPSNHLYMTNYSTDTQHNKCHHQPKQTQKRMQQHQQKHHQPSLPLELNKNCSMEELRTTVQTVASSIEHSSQDVRHLGQKMVAATEMITDRVEENAQALNLLAEVVDKLQGIIVVKKHLEASPPCKPKLHIRPIPPPRGSSVSPKVIHKPSTPYPRPISPSSASSSSSSASSCLDGFTMSQSPQRSNRGIKIRTRAVDHDINGHIKLKNGSVSRAQQENKQDFNTTGCLKTKKKK